MPRLSPLGDALCGIAGVELSINGATPALFAGVPSGYWQWLTNTVIVGQADLLADNNYHLYDYDTVGLSRVEIDTRGANQMTAGNSVWTAWLGGTGVYTSVPSLGPFPLGYALHTSFQGEMALLTSYAAGSGIRIYDATGALLDTVNGTLVGLPPSTGLFLRDGVMTYDLGGGYLLRDYLNQTNLSILIRSDQGNWSCPMFDGTDYWVLERTSGDLLTLRKILDTTAWVISGPSANLFNPEVMLLSPGVARIAWSATIGEEADQLLVMDLTLATGANDLATVVAGALVFVPQAPLSTMAVSGTVSPGGGGGGGGTGGGPSSSGKSVLDRRAAPPPPLKEPRVYPHVPQIQDFAAKQSVKLAWDQLSGQAETLRTLEATVASQAQDIADLKQALADLRQGSNAAYQGVE